MSKVLNILLVIILCLFLFACESDIKNELVKPSINPNDKVEFDETKLRYYLDILEEELYYDNKRIHDANNKIQDIGTVETYMFDIESSETIYTIDEGELEISVIDYKLFGTHTNQETSGVVYCYNCFYGSKDYIYFDGKSNSANPSWKTDLNHVIPEGKYVFTSSEDLDVVYESFMQNKEYLELDTYQDYIRYDDYLRDYLFFFSQYEGFEMFENKLEKSFSISVKVDNVLKQEAMVFLENSLSLHIEDIIDIDFELIISFQESHLEQIYVYLDYETTNIIHRYANQISEVMLIKYNFEKPTDTDFSDFIVKNFDDF